jgi:hypothetical protein
MKMNFFLYFLLMTSALIAGVLKIPIYTTLKTLNQNTNCLLHLAVSDSSAPRINLGSKISALDGKVVELLSLDVEIPNGWGL